MIQIETVIGSGVKISCSRDELVTRLAVIARAVSTRATVQILSGVLLQETEGRVTLAATDMEQAQLFTVDRAALLDTAARVGRSASRDESRPVLTGVLIRFEAGKLVMAATDSYRLSVKETELDASTPELEAIVPARALTELARIAQGADDIQLGIHENHVVFTTADAWLTTRRIDGQFPNHKQLIPETFEYELALPRTELLDVVRRTAVLAQRNSPLRLRF